MTTNLPMAPKTRGECPAVRPCPHATCRYHLQRIDTPLVAGGHKTSAGPSGSESCSLDVAERGEHDNAFIGRLLGISRERVRQIEAKALMKAAMVTEALGLRFEDLEFVQAGIERGTYLDDPESLNIGGDKTPRVCKSATCGKTYTPGVRGQQQSYCSRKCGTDAWRSKVVGHKARP